MTVSFPKRKFKALLGAASAKSGMMFGMIVFDFLAVGSLLGEEKLAGFAIVVPVLSTGRFLADLIAFGAEYMFSRRMGSFARERARESVGTALIAAGVLGAAMALVMTLGRDFYLGFMGVSGDVRETVLGCWAVVTCYLAILPSLRLVEMLVYADGDLKLSSVGKLADVAVYIPAAIGLVAATDSIAGVTLAATLGEFVQFGILTRHFVRPGNEVVPRWRFSWRDLRDMLALSVTDSSVQVCWAGAILVLNAFTIVRFGERFLPVTAIAFSAIEISIFLDGIGQAFMPIAGMYFGERNFPDLRVTVNYACRISVVLGLAVGAVLFAAAPVLPIAYGVKDPAVFASAVFMLRALAFAMPFMSVLLMMTSQYVTMDAVALPVTITAFKDFVLLVAVPVGFGWAWGFNVLWIGVPAGYAFALVCSFAFVRVARREAFPWLIPPDDGTRLNVSYPLSIGSIRGTSAAIERFLVAHKVPPKTVLKTQLIVEETTMLGVEHNGDGKAVGEASVTVESLGGVRLITRDDGVIFDVTDADQQLQSFRCYVVANLMSAQREKNYLLTVSCNRAEYRF